MQFSLFTIIAYDNHQNGILVAWALMERAKSVDISQFLNALKGRVEEKRKELMLDHAFGPNSMIIDVASEEINAIKYVTYSIHTPSLF